MALLNKHHSSSLVFVKDMYIYSRCTEYRRSFGVSLNLIVDVALLRTATVPYPVAKSHCTDTNQLIADLGPESP